MALYAVGGFGFGAITLGDDGVLESAGEYYDAVLLGVFGKELLAFLAYGACGLLLLLLHEVVDELLCFLVGEFAGLALHDAVDGACEIGAAEVLYSHAFEVVADDHAEGVAEFFHNGVLCCIMLLILYDLGAKVQLFLASVSHSEGFLYIWGVYLVYY